MDIYDQIPRHLFGAGSHRAIKPPEAAWTSAGGVYPSESVTTSAFTGFA